MTWTVRVAGVDLRTLGFRLERPEGHLTPGLTAPGTVAVPGPFGEQPTGAAGTLAPRRLTLRGSLAIRDVAPGPARAAARDTAIAALLAHCAGGGAQDARSQPVTIELATTTGRAWSGALDPATTVELLGLSARDGAARVALSFVCPDPCARDLATTDVALSAVAAALPIGTAVSGAVIVLPGAWASGAARTLTYTDGAGVTRASLTITPSVLVAAGTWVEVDLEAQTIVHVTAAGATRTLRAAWRTAGGWFLVAPGDAVGGVAPKLAVSAGGGAAGGTATLARRWR